MTKISIIIRTKNEAKSLEKTLKIINSQDTNLSHEIIIVDSFSTDNTKYVAKKYDCKIINLSPNNFSWGKGINIGMENSKGEFCILLSAHSYPVDTKWMDRLVEPLLGDENVAASYGGQIPRRGVDPFEEIELEKWFPKSNKKLAISNSNVCIRKSVWQEIKFNEVLSSYEDVEWAIRVQDAGYKLKYVPEATVYHSHNINVNSIYRRWYWRTRMAVNVHRKKEKIVLASKLPSELPSFLLSLGFYITLLFEDIAYCIKEKYLSDLWKASFYDFIRAYALYNGCRDGLKDIKYGCKMNKFEYYGIKIPKIVSTLKFLES